MSSDLIPGGVTMGGMPSSPLRQGHGVKYPRKRVNAIHPAVCDATRELLATCDWSRAIPAMAVSGLHKPNTTKSLFSLKLFQSIPN